jgi:hypothetical protein
VTEQTLQQRAEALLADYPPGTAYDYPLYDYIEVTSDLLAENARLRARLEIDSATDGGGTPVPFPEGAPDGIACRDETIRLLEQKIASLKYGNKTLKKTNMRLTRRVQEYKTQVRNTTSKRRKVKALSDACGAALG